MNAADLITILRRYDPKLPVIVEGYEGGYDDVIAVDDIYILLNENEDIIVFGLHMESDRDNPKNIPAIFLRGQRGER